MLHLEAVLAEPLDAHNVGQWYITDGSFALCLCVAKRLRCQAEEALLEVAPAKASAHLRPFRHQTVYGLEEKMYQRIGSYRV